jgi:hypothetical protein
MRRTLGFLYLLAIVSLSGACTTEKTANDNTAPKNGVVETNANVNQNMNANTAPSNVGVVTNNNGNKNTAGVRAINANENANANSNQNGKRKTGNRNN